METMVLQVVERRAGKSHTRLDTGVTVEPGTTLWCIRDRENQMFFVWAYLDKVVATRVAHRLPVMVVNTADHWRNWKPAVEECIISARTAMEVARDNRTISGKRNLEGARNPKRRSGYNVDN